MRHFQQVFELAILKRVYWSWRVGGNSVYQSPCKGHWLKAPITGGNGGSPIRWIDVIFCKMHFLFHRGLLMAYESVFVVPFACGSPLLNVMAYTWRVAYSIINYTAFNMLEAASGFHHNTTIYCTVPCWFWASHFAHGKIQHLRHVGIVTEIGRNTSWNSLALQYPNWFFPSQVSKRQHSVRAS